MRRWHSAAQLEPPRLELAAQVPTLTNGSEPNDNPAAQPRVNYNLPQRHLTILPSVRFGRLPEPIDLFGLFFSPFIKLQPALLSPKLCICS